MKTTIELADDLAKRAKAFARRRGTTLRAVVEDGFRPALEREKAGAPYRLPDKRFGGKGLQTEFGHRAWSEIREAAYDGKLG